MPKLYFAIILMVSLGGNLAAQDERFGTIGVHSIEANYQFGRIIPHNSRFKAPVTRNTQAIELNYYFQTLGKKAWQRKLHYPEIGGSFYCAINGDQKIFGNAYALMGTVKFWIVRSKYVDFYVRAATGLAITPTHYNIVTNPKNNAIGSLINSIDQARIGIDYKPEPGLQFGVGVTFTHYSNAAVQQPNLGINVPAFTFGIRYFPRINDKLKYNREKWGKPEKKNEVAVKFSVGFHDKLPFNGPHYPVYIGTVNYARFTSVANKFLAGVSAEFDHGAFDFYGFDGNPTKYPRGLASTNISIFVGDEVMMGKAGLMFAAGWYAFNPRKDIPVYVKMGLNYYYVSLGKSKNTKLFVGANLKSHFFVAQFCEFSAGVAF